MPVSVGNNINAHSVASIFNPQGNVIDAESRRVDDQASQRRIPPPEQQPQIRNNRQAIQLLDQQEQQREQQNNTTFDLPGRNGQQAVSAYQSLANQEKRSELESMLGVDIYV